MISFNKITIGLVLYVFFFLYVLYYWSKMYKNEKEKKIEARLFDMVIHALFLLLAKWCQIKNIF